METSGDGKRRFLVSTVTNFYRRYSDMLPHHRHYYEIIREGQPCHIYFGELGSGEEEFESSRNAIDGPLSLPSPPPWQVQSRSQQIPKIPEPLHAASQIWSSAEP